MISSSNVLLPLLPHFPIPDLLLERQRPLTARRERSFKSFHGRVAGRG
jgi:hypothetical protein